MGDNDEPLVSDQEALELGSASFFAAVGEGAKVVVPAVVASSGWQAMLAVALPLMGLAVAKGAHRLFAPRTALLAKGYGKAFGDDPKRVEEHDKQHEHDPDYHETMFRTFRAMMDAAEPEVVETLGYLAGVYRIAGRKPDALFRGLGRLLADLESGELDELRILMARAHELRGDLLRSHESFIGRMERKQAQEAQLSDPGDLRINLNVTTGNDGGHVVEKVTASVHGSEHKVGTFRVAHRLFALLRKEGLAGGQPAAQGFHKFMGDQTVTISLRMVESIAAVVAPG